jgi:hypothetical protein
MGSSGPVVIDWTNARSGQAPFDVALSWVLMTAGEIPGNRLRAAVMGPARGLLVGGFLRSFDRAPVEAAIRSVVAWKVADPHISEAEQRRMWDLVERVEGRSAV